MTITATDGTTLLPTASDKGAAKGAKEGQGRAEGNAIDAQALVKTFRQGGSPIPALRDLSLNVQRGEFVCIMGASGSGKSTLLHLLAGLTRPDQGSIAVAGRNVLSMPDGELTAFRRRQIGIVFQAYNLIPTLTVTDNVLLPSEAGGRKDGAEGRLDELLDDLGLAECRQRYPDTLSGGQQQRVAIARALVTAPAVVLADEPTGNLDSVTGQGLCELLRQFNERDQHTIVLVTHDPLVAMWSDRIVVLKDGQAIADLKTADFADAKELAACYFDLNSSSANKESR